MVKVTYPKVMVYGVRKHPYLSQQPSYFGHLHGPTKKNPNHLIIEDAQGMVHVVNKELVTEAN